MRKVSPSPWRGVAAAPLLGMILSIAHGAPAPAQRLCVVCDERISGQIFLFKDLARGDQKFLCKPCTQLTNHCFSCAIPLKTPTRAYADGRQLCGHDAHTAVVSAEQAESLFTEVRRDLHRMFAGYEPIPYRNLELRLVDLMPALPRESQKEEEHRQWINLGITETTRAGDGGLRHTFYLLQGLSPARFAAVAAHEFAHAWLHANLPLERKIHPDTVEAFCELIAYKLMTDRQHEFEKRVILHNLYTKGQIHTLIKIENEIQLHRLFDWMRSGRDDRILADDSSGAIRLKRTEPPPPLYYPAAAPTVYSHLVLKAITGPARNRLALINNTTFSAGERGRVFVGGSNVTIRCLEIRAESVLVQPEGEAAPVELSLGAPAPAAAP